MNINPKREITESFDDYKNRMKTNSIILRNYLKGKFVWNRGTYKKGDNNEKDS